MRCRCEELTLPSPDLFSTQSSWLSLFNEEESDDMEEAEDAGGTYPGGGTEKLGGGMPGGIPGGGIIPGGR